MDVFRVRFREFVGAAAVTGIPSAVQGQQPPQSKLEAVTAFEHVAVVPMDRERVLRDQTIVVRGNRIVALGSAKRVRVPASAVRVDGRGKYLIPGLADMHAHIPGGALIETEDDAQGFPDSVMRKGESDLFLFVANGVTTIRVMHGWPQTLQLRERAARGELLSPRLYVARRSLGNVKFTRGGMPSTHWNDYSPARVVADVEAAKAAGYDLYKVHGELQGGTPAHDSLIMAARRVGLPVAGHVPSGFAQGDSPGPQSLVQAVEAGYASIEHLLGFEQYLVDSAEYRAHAGSLFWDSTPGHLDRRKLRAIARRLHQAGVWNCPTLNHITGDGGRAIPIEQWPEMSYLSESGRRRWSQAHGLRQRLPASEAQIAFDREIIRALRDAGAGLLLGTDSPFVLMAGFAVHQELVALVRAGLSPYEALATGTRNVAAYFGTLDSTGTVAVGKRADLVLLSGNPLQNVWATAHPAGVMVNGRWLDRAELNARLPAAIASASAAPRMVER